VNGDIGAESEREGGRIEPPPLYQPIFLASSTRNAKVIALAVSALQRLITTGAVPAVSLSLFSFSLYFRKAPFNPLPQKKLTSSRVCMYTVSSGTDLEYSRTGVASRSGNSIKDFTNSR